jgi:acyl dehydratase
MTTPELDFDRSLLGKEHHAGPFKVTRELIDGFCATLGETNPLYLDGEAARSAGYEDVLAPNSLCTLFVHDVVLPDINLNFGKGRGRVHAGQVLETLGPIQAGDSLSSASRLKEVYAKTGRTGTMVFIVWQTVFSNQQGQAVAAVEESYAARE